MKRIVLSLISVFIFSFAHAQINIFHENFEVVDSMTSSGIPTWFQQAGLQVSGSHCMRDTVAANDTSYLTTIAFSTVGNFNVLLDFWHICKISFTDAGIVEVSNNNGTTWHRLTSAEYLSVSGFSTNNLFSSVVYGQTGTGWDPFNDFTIPTNTWWKHELFDISTFGGNASNVKVRFRLQDGNTSGSDGNYGWLIDDVNVVESAHELFPPHIAWAPAALQGNIYNLGPYTIKDTIIDPSGLGPATLYYSLNGAALVPVTMTLVSGNVYQGIIPAVNNGDTICYYVQASDTWGNTAVLPAAGTNCIYASSGIVFPYFDNFDVTTNLWTPIFGSGSHWELGTPSFGATNTAHSPPNSWDIDLASGYQNLSHDTLLSPVLNFNGIYNPVLSFWLNYNTELAYDGTRLEYTLDAGTTWQVLGAVNDPRATNWYNRAILNSSLKPAWAGNSNGWHQSTYRLGCLFTTSPSGVQFRFIFTSDGSLAVDGCSMDDFSVTLAPPNDIGVTAVLRPGFSAPAGINDTVKIVIANLGSNPASGFNIHYSVNGGAAVSQLFSGTIMPCDVDTVIFTTPYTVPSGTFNLCAFTSLLTDGNHSNDTMCKSSQGIPLLNLPYTDNFETPPALWYDSSAAGTNWQLGIPNYGVTNSVHSPVNAWDVNLDTSYLDNAYSVLTSPLFNVSGIYNPKLSFWLNYKTENGWDGTRLEYSLDEGTSWSVLGTVNDLNATNWYTDLALNSSQLPAWEDTSGGWKKSTYRLGSIPGLNNNATPIQFKFVFTSDGSIVKDGATMDDFAINLAPPQDVGVSSVFDPGVYTTVGAIDTVKVKISNYGGLAASNFNVGYSVNGVQIATQLHPAILQPGATDTLVFTIPFTVPVGVFDLCAYTLLAGDGDVTNDTLCGVKHGIPLFTLPYFDSFDTGAVVWFDSSATPTTIWELGVPNYQQTTGAHSAPNSWDINLNSAYGTNALSNLVSPLFDFTGIVNAKLTFWQNRNIQNFGDGFRVDYTTNGGINWNVLGTPFDPLATYWYTDVNLFNTQAPAWNNISIDTLSGANGWIKSTYKLSSLNNAGNKVMFKFVFTSDGFGTADGVSIDDFKIVPPTALDASAIWIVQPGQLSPAGASDSVKVRISNEGLNPISNFSVSYKINGVLAGTGIYTGTLQPGVNDTIALSPFVVPTGTFDICAFTSLTGDGDLSNDTTCKSSFGIPLVPISYFDDFEGANNFFSDGNDWQFGTPASTSIDSAYSPVHAWKTILAGNYSFNDNDYLYSPFFDFQNAYKAELKFYHWYLTDIASDGGRIDYSTDGGNTWQVLGFQGDPAGTNWYTNANIFVSGKPAWTGNSHGYKLSKYKLDFLNGWNTGLVQFRFNFSSTGFGVNNGWAIDNFEVYNPTTLTAAPVSISGINNPFAITGPQTISTYIKNKGSFDLFACDATLQVDGVTIVTDHNIPFAPALATGDSALHQFTVPWTPTLGGHFVCAITSLPNGSADLDPSDDTTCAYAGVFDSVTVTNSNPYCNDFEPGNGHPLWIPLNAFNYALFNSDWQLGTPAKTIINSAHSGVNAWATKLSGDYNPKDTSGLFSPVFAVDTIGCYELSFWHNYLTETYQDGGVVEYSFNSGASWRILGFAFEANWYTSQYITGLVGGPPTPGWSGVSNGWSHAAHNIKFAHSGHVIFRFRFGSDLTNQQEGWAIDDVCFKRVGACVIGINEIGGTDMSLENFPNPASDIAYITYSIPEHGKVKLFVTDVLGRDVSVLANESQSGGSHLAELNVKNLADGMYYITLEYGDSKMVRKLVVVK